MYEIKEISQEEVRALLKSVEKSLAESKNNYKWEPYGLFYSEEKNNDGSLCYVGYDNSIGNCWVEAFNDLETCISWLKGDFNVGEET